jgi:hypothetical protein
MQKYIAAALLGFGAYTLHGCGDGADKVSMSDLSETAASQPGVAAPTVCSDDVITDMDTCAAEWVPEITAAQATPNACYPIEQLLKCVPVVCCDTIDSTTSATYSAGTLMMINLGMEAEIGCTGRSDFVDPCAASR